ncbi:MULTISPECIES: DUF397 domain-containing protein [unclassified Kitasatospora]|uniref:DUF397 domain-containing protein n=1 Tax=unclassified Kitasatospora TaxID=2633591 RepID=UPI0038122596
MLQTDWQKSSFSSATDTCMEVRTAGEVVELRESVTGDVIVQTTAVKFAKFLQGVKAGEFDHHADFNS